MNSNLSYSPETLKIGDLDDVAETDLSDFLFGSFPSSIKCFWHILSIGSMVWKLLRIHQTGAQGRKCVATSNLVDQQRWYIEPVSLNITKFAQQYFQTKCDLQIQKSHLNDLLHMHRDRCAADAYAKLCYYLVRKTQIVNAHIIAYGMRAKFLVKPYHSFKAIR